MKYRCRGIRPYDGGAWRALIDEFTENKFTWLTRPLVRGSFPAETTEPSQANTSEWGNSQPYFDALLGRYYNEVEMEQVQRDGGSLMMNLAYDLCSVDPLLSLKKPRTGGGTFPAGGSEDAETDPPDVLEFWHARGDALLRSPTRENDPNAATASCRGGLPPFLLRGDVGEPTHNGPTHADFQEEPTSQSVPVEAASPTSAPQHLGGRAPVTPENAHLCHAEDQGPDRPCRDANHSKAGGNEWPRSPECMGEEPKRRGKWRASSSTEQSGRQPGACKDPPRSRALKRQMGETVKHVRAVSAENSRAPWIHV